MNKILIVDDHATIRFALRTIFEREGNNLVSETNNSNDALSMAKELEPDLIVLDLSLPELCGLDVIPRLLTFNTKIKILVFTAHNPTHFTYRCMMAGAAGFVWKQGDIAEILEATKAIRSGYSFFPNIIRGQDQQQGNSKEKETEQMAQLSNRETMVLQCLAQGMLNKEIADRMLISEKTVSTYKTRLLIKLHMNSLLELIEFSKRNKVIH